MAEVNGPAAYSLYDLFRTLIERVGWPTEEEKRAALASVDQAERMQVFGNLASAMVCDHPTGETDREGRCVDCGRGIVQVVHKYGAGPRRVRDWGRY